MNLRVLKTKYKTLEVLIVSIKLIPKVRIVDVFFSCTLLISALISPGSIL